MSNQLLSYVSRYLFIQSFIHKFIRKTDWIKSAPCPHNKPFPRKHQTKTGSRPCSKDKTPHDKTSLVGAMTPAITWFLLGLLRIVACEVQNDFFFEYGSKIFEIGRDMAENIAGMAFSGASGTSAEKPVMYRNRVDRNITVQTSYGVVKGRAAVTMRRRKEYLAFLGMPYAAPPLGDLRFKVSSEKSYKFSKLSERKRQETPPV